jgi:hypothetical protein
MGSGPNWWDISLYIHVAVQIVIAHCIELVQC